MNYELAKRLWKAGFPYKKGKEYHTCYTLESLSRAEAPIIVPDLSELIEACGDQFDNIRHQDVGTWTATDKKGFMILACSTPEEAVAGLWLSLNKK